MIREPRDATTPGRDVFVSYAAQDRAVGNTVVESLERHGLKCRIGSRDAAPRREYGAAAIDGSSVLVLVFSDHSIASMHVGRDIEWAASGRRRIIVLRTAPAPLTRSFEYFLRESQWIDVTALGLPAALTELTQAVEQRLAPSLWVSPGLGADVRDPADRRRKLTYLTIKRVISVAMFLGVAAVVVGVLIRYWPK